MFSKREGCSVRGGKVFIHLRGNGAFLFLLRNLAAGFWWDTPKAILGLITFSFAVIHCIRQNGIDFGCLLFKFYGRGGFFWLACSRYRFMARESNRNRFNVSSGLFSSTGI